MRSAILAAFVLGYPSLASAQGTAAFDTEWAAVGIGPGLSGGTFGPGGHARFSTLRGPYYFWSIVDLDIGKGIEGLEVTGDSTVTLFNIGSRLGTMVGLDATWRHQLWLGVRPGLTSISAEDDGEGRDLFSISPSVSYVAPLGPNFTFGLSVYATFPVDTVGEGAYPYTAFLTVDIGTTPDRLLRRVFGL